MDQKQHSVPVTILTKQFCDYVFNTVNKINAQVSIIGGGGNGDFEIDLEYKPNKESDVCNFIDILMSWIGVEYKREFQMDDNNWGCRLMVDFVATKDGIPIVFIEVKNNTNGIRKAIGQLLTYKALGEQIYGENEDIDVDLILIAPSFTDFEVDACHSVGITPVSFKVYDWEHHPLVIKN